MMSWQKRFLQSNKIYEYYNLLEKLYNTLIIYYVELYNVKNHSQLKSIKWKSRKQLRHLIR